MHKCVKRVAVHWYGNKLENFERLDQTHIKHLNQFILTSAACIAHRNSLISHIVLGNWEFGKTYTWLQEFESLGNRVG